MAFTVAQLALTDDRKQQLEAALANSELEDPLEQAIAEAVSEVSRLTAGFVIEEASLNSWTRKVALYNCFVIAELSVPEDIKDAYDDTMEELRAIASGKRTNLPRIDVTPAPGKGTWGSAEKIS
jgi:ribonucleotide reductase alpha subunit